MSQQLRYVGLYFSAVLVLTIPFWILSNAVDFQPLPGLSIAAFAVICPALAAALVSLKRGGPVAVAILARQGLKLGRTGLLLVPVLLINPVLFGLAYVVAGEFGAEVPLPVFSISHALILLLLFLPTAWLEEIGWTGFALPGLRTRFGPLGSGLVLGLFWALWHIPALLELGRPLDWIAWWGLWTVSTRIIMVWIAERTGGSVLVATLYHALSNLSWQLYPDQGSHFDPQISGLLTFGLALGLTIWSAAHGFAPSGRRGP